MLRRIYCLVPNLQVARKVVDEMLLARAWRRSIFMYSRSVGRPLKTSPRRR